jgi:hypothetical protein
LCARTRDERFDGFVGVSARTRTKKEAALAVRAPAQMSTNETDKSDSERATRAMARIERASQSFLAHLNACSCDRTECEAALDECVVMIQREQGELMNLRERITLEEHVQRMEEVQSIRHGLVDGIIRSGVMNKLSCVSTALAVRYLDFFVVASGYKVKSDSLWMYQLLAAACVFIAYKFQETSERMHGRGTSARLQLTNDISFDNLSIRKMEAIILRELDWSLSRVTPFMFIPHFLLLLDCECNFRACRNLTAQVLHGAEVLSLQILFDIRTLSRFESSVIAKAIIAIVLCDQCDGVEGVDIAEQMVARLLRYLYADEDIKQLDFVTRRVTECIEDILEFRMSLMLFNERMNNQNDAQPPGPISAQQR